MTTGGALMRLSEYGKSYTCIDNLRDEYYDRLQFRIRKRNSEYSHHPFLWDDLECINSSPSDLSLHTDVRPTKNDVSTKTTFTPEDGHSDNVTEDSVIVKDPHVFNYEKKDSDNVSTPSKIDIGTQTEKACLLEAINQPKAFVPYAIGGSPGPSCGARRTFNVKSDRDVYPSAVRADARRKEKLVSYTHTNTSNNKVSSKLYGPKQCIGKREAMKLAKTEKSVHIPHNSTKVNVPQLSGLGASNSYSNNHANWRPTDSWVSEYVQKYPSYPSSVYVRSASVAAGRCRPLCFPYNRPFSSFLESLVPSTPVLLSCRGSNSTVRSRRETHCDVCSGANLNERCTRPLLSAR
ncbi:unnamed protein product [Schistosoma turkestanicum]|nr:unnamed protein product [Schistosoma turkestanicum]